MGIVERRERERDEVRRKILDAARDLFMAEGYERVTMRRIADAIEYSPTTIYNHFKDKDDLVDALCHAEFSQLLSALDLRDRAGDPVLWIRQIGAAYAKWGLENPNHYAWLFLSRKPFGEDHHPSEPAVQSFAVLRDAVARAIESGAFIPGNPDTMAQVLWASLHGAIALLINFGPNQFPGAPAAPDLIDQVLDNSARGFLNPKKKR
jgi:AcrR family transcriptional regulator